jgi:aspartate racemase
LSAAARSLEAAGADFFLLCTNTLHKTADELQQDVAIPFLHIADATAQAIAGYQLQKVGLLGTKTTMEDDFYHGRLTRRHGLQVLVPPADEREAVHRIIFDELCLGQINPQSRNKHTAIMEDLVRAGAEGIVLGCTKLVSLLASAIAACRYSTRPASTPRRRQSSL